MADNGYYRNVDQIREAARQVVVDLSAKIANQGTFQQTRPLVSTENESKPADPIYPTDLIQDLGVQIEPLPDVPELDMNKAVTEPPKDPQMAVDNHEKNVNMYMEADQRIKSEFLAELNNVDPEVAAAVEGAMPAPGGASSLAMLGSLADDAIVPGAGDIWRAIDDIMSQTSNPNSQRVQAAISQTITNLQGKVAEQVQQASNTPGAPKPIRWDKLDPDPQQAVQQMQNFLMRDPKQDPLMQIAQDNVPKLEMMQKNFENYNEIYLQARQNINAEMVAVAAEAGDRNLVQRLVGGGEMETEMAMEGQAVAALTKAPAVSNSFELDARLKPSEVSGVKAANDDIYDLDEGAKEIAKMAFNLEPPKHMMKPDFSPGAAA